MEMCVMSCEAKKKTGNAMRCGDGQGLSRSERPNDATAPPDA
jgi:hypothetical protein